MKPSYFCGLDGEGQGRSPHRYVLLAYSDESGKRVNYVEDMRGLSTSTCLEWLFEEVPNRARLFAYSFGYDLTKILVDLTDGQLYRLFRPELRARIPRPDGIPRPPHPVPWRANGWTYKLNYQGSKFSVSRGNKTRVVWDVFKFFQGKFTTALEDWKIGTEAERAEIARMKEKRGEFDKQKMVDVTDYCLSECRKMAELVRKLTEAHDAAGLELRAYHGAGSTGGAVLKKLKIEEKIRPVPETMRDAVARAFFGGRFEHSVLGSIDGPVFSYDISSAYPYWITHLPCLVHGQWEKTRSVTRIEAARHALVRYRLGDAKKLSWGPFPFRDKDGAIVYALTSPGGWVWKDEFFEGALGFDHVGLVEAWVLESSCDCQPFARIPQWYKERLRIGKEGAGIVLKLGMNSVYGKLAQSVGTAPFQSWAWAGMVTSGCRAQILHALRLHKDRSNMLAVATDGIYTREEIRMAEPKDTNTWICVGPKGEKIEKPLGGWERKVVPPPSVFFARPGIYFPLDPTTELRQVRARGVGRGPLRNNWEKIVRAFKKDEAWTELPDVVRFRGAKTGISADDEARETGGRGGILTRARSYGEWETRPTVISFDPRPKREGDYRRRGKYAVLTPRKLSTIGDESEPYSRAKVSIEAKVLKAFAQEMLEQPDPELLEDWEDGGT